MTSKGMRSVRPGFSKGRKPAFRSTEPQGMRSVSPGFSKGRKPAFRSTEPQGRKVRKPKNSPAVRSPGTKSKEPKVATSLNKGAASPIRFFIGGFNDGTTAKKSLAGYIPFDGAKCGFLDLPYDPRVRGTKAVEPKMRKPKAVEPKKNTNPPDVFAVPVRFSNDINDAIEAITRCLKLKDRTDGSKAVEPKMRKPKAVEPGQNTNSPHEVGVPSFQFWNLEDDANDVDVRFQLLNLEDDSRDDSTHSRILT